jgi:hypothetical protein
MYARIITILLCCAALVNLAGCGLFRDAPPPSADVALTAHNPVSLQNYKTARGYASEGRLELAREHYLLAYAAAGGNAALRTALEKELRAVDMMLKTLR